METLDTFQAVIEAFGGPTKYADAIGIPGFHAQSMKTRGSIPPAYWVDTVSAARERNVEGVTLEKLAELAKEKRPQPEAAQ
jgi:hypothetical protein